MEVYFSGLLSAGNDYPLKPDPAMYEEVIRRFSLKKERILAVGDREIDIQAGREAGVHTCLFGEGNMKTQADLSINDYSHLMEYLLRENEEV
jgi:FMN phosphatase YigB (HAD superfamily)